ncbi:hypothetical protein L596_005732 [Steinernema carpocapsae]|uniref:Uncharacterized protein n=1 Tax=Steinernema carpocapsae TaxID=34508 RepID=A0A4U8V078_STECR|nr:hypothetical protein L596_005732 [Steinernema carpocapsae]
MPRYNSIHDDVDLATKWWSDYPTGKYTDMARAQTTYDSFINDVWSKPKRKRLVRSASFTNLTYIKETVHDHPITRSESVSSLAPSLALPQHCREAPRIVHTVPVYKPFTYDWYSKAYSTARYKDTHETIAKPLKRSLPTPEYSSHVPYYTMQTRRIFNDQRLVPYKSYLRGSQDYLNKYVSARVKADDFAQNYAYSAYEWRKPQDHAFNRHFMYGEKVYIPHAPSIPHSYTDSQALRRLYVTTGRFRFA